MLIALVLRVGYVQLFDVLFTGDDAGSPALQLVRVSGWVLPLPNGAHVCFSRCVIKHSRDFRATMMHY